MPRSVPIFRSQEEIYTADACTPLIEAAARGDVRLHALVHGHYPGQRLPAEALPGLKTAGFWDAGLEQRWGLPWHRNEGLELTYLESGTLGFAVEDREWKLEPDQLTLTRPWQRHRVGNPNTTPGRLHWVIVDVGVRRPNQEWRWPSWVVLCRHDLDELSNILRHCEQPVWKASAEIRRCFQAIGHAVQSDREGSHLSALTLRLNELFMMVLELLRKKAVLDSSLSSTLRTVELFLADLREHPENLSIEWTVQQMASSCGLGTTQFIQYVRRITNMTPLHYLNDCRFRHAARLLKSAPQMNVTDIALECGFSSGQYFATVFGRRFGCSPSEYREAATRDTPAELPERHGAN